VFLARRIIIQYAQMTRRVSKNIKVKKMHAAKWLVVLLLAGAAQGPGICEAKQESPVARPSAMYLTEIEAIYQKGLAASAAALKKNDMARDALAKAEVEQKKALASGDKQRIKVVAAELLKAKDLLSNTSQTLNRVVSLVDRLNVLNDKAKNLSGEDKFAKLEALVKRADAVFDFVNEILRSHPSIIIVVPPPCTTSTTLPSPTPVGRRG